MLFWDTTLQTEPELLLVDFIGFIGFGSFYKTGAICFIYVPPIWVTIVINVLLKFNNVIYLFLFQEVTFPESYIFCHFFLLPNYF